VLDPSLLKGSFTPEEDEAIVLWVREHGSNQWEGLAALLPGRLGKQCRERWRHNLDPALSHAPWTDAEDEILIEAAERIGTKWAKLTEFLPGRSENSIRNRWRTFSGKRIARERLGGELPKHGRPVKHGPKRAAQPSAFDELGPVADRPLQMSGLVMASHLLSPLSRPRSSLSPVSPAIDLVGFSGWSPMAGEAPEFAFSPSPAPSPTDEGFAVAASRSPPASPTPELGRGVGFADRIGGLLGEVGFPIGTGDGMDEDIVRAIATLCDMAKKIEALSANEDAD
jgi:hypothetical protein